ncbi:MAG: hypothetical protein BWX66_01063 [Deltaproteobacteria bacterium ADurb.Bin058]|nr:MAG: hypothetical protein BWX66_01063 [Deltaproteobacteria bacterium ADurb.Bin058]
MAISTSGPFGTTSDWGNSFGSRTVVPAFDRITARHASNAAKYICLLSACLRMSSSTRGREVSVTTLDRAASASARKPSASSSVNNDISCEMFPVFAMIARFTRPTSDLNPFSTSSFRSVNRSWTRRSRFSTFSTTAGTRSLAWAAAAKRIRVWKWLMRRAASAARLKASDILLGARRRETSAIVMKSSNFRDRSSTASTIAETRGPLPKSAASFSASIRSSWAPFFVNEAWSISAAPVLSCRWFRNVANST